MKRIAPVFIVLVLPLAGCVQPRANQILKPSEPEKEATDRRPAAGRKPIGQDLTALARQQNRPGRAPDKPNRRGTVSPSRLRPKVKTTTTGFVARLPGARRVPTPAYYRGKLFTGGYGTYELHALDADTGKTQWSLHLSDDGPTAPACEDGVCVVNTYSCTMFGVDADTGEHLWSWWLGSPQLATPVIAGGTVYTSYPGDGPPGARFVLAAFDLKTGSPKWRRWIDGEVNSTPVADRGHIYVATQMGTLYQFSAAKGDVVAVRGNRIASPPVITTEGILYGREEMPKGDDLIATAHPIFPELEPARDRAPSRVEPRPRPLVAGGTLVRVERGAVIAADHKSGRQLWAHRLSGERPAEVSAPLLYAGRSILLATAAGNVLRMAPDSGEVMATYPLGQGQLASQPIVHDGWIYAGTTGGSVVGYDTGQPELTGWEMLGGGPDRRGIADPEAS